MYRILRNLFFFTDFPNWVMWHGFRWPAVLSSTFTSYSNKYSLYGTSSILLEPNVVYASLSYSLGHNQFVIYNRWLSLSIDSAGNAIFIFKETFLYMWLLLIIFIFGWSSTLFIFRILIRK